MSQKTRKRRPSRAAAAAGLVVAASATWIVACSGRAGDPEANERSGSTSQAATLAPAHADPVGAAFFYFRSNSTDWGADEGSRLLPTQNPAVFSRTIDYTLGYDDTASLTETFASAPDEWGNKQVFFYTPNQATFVVPNTVALASGSTELNFGVRYPHTGQYVVTFDSSQGTLAIAPAGQDAGTDAGIDGGDSGSDGGAGGSWTPLANQPSFSPDTALLLTDGRVAVHVGLSSAWWCLTPDVNGSYVHGTWSSLASMPSGYAPLYFASAVLPDGRLIVEGGEYNVTTTPTWTSLGAIYDPVANAWTAVSPPSGWTSIGDAESAVLANGTFFVANALSSQQALFDAATLGWSPTGAGKADGNDEEGWTLLASGKVLTVDVGDAPQSELYDPSTGTWSPAGSTGVVLANGSGEVGPAVLMANGVVFATGGTPHTALYDTASGTWSTGPDFPVVSSGQLDVADGPAALLPNGHVLVAASPGTFESDTHFFEFDGSTLTEVARTPNAPNTSSFTMRLLVLPTGQVLQTDGSTDVEVYTPTGAANAAWEPSITSVATTLSRGSTFVLHGRQLNGLSQASAYGDDAQSATNYPLVRITNDATGHVFYARTHGHSSMGVATGTLDVSTSFDVPPGAETGASRLQAVANGIASAPVAVTVQ